MTYGKSLGSPVIGLSLALMLLVAGSRVASGQGGPLPVAQISTRPELEELLVFVGRGENWLVPAALLARSDDRTGQLLLEIATDRGASRPQRISAFRVLRLRRDPDAARALLDVVRDEPDLGFWARTALETFPDTEVCTFWRRELADPSVEGSDLWSALVGIKYCGSAADTVLVLSRRRSPQTVADRELIHVALEVLAVPLPQRLPDRGYNFGPGLVRGTYQPSPAARLRIDEWLCRGGPCPPLPSLTGADLMAVMRQH